MKLSLSLLAGACCVLARTTAASVSIRGGHVTTEETPLSNVAEPAIPIGHDQNFINSIHAAMYGPKDGSGTASDGSKHRVLQNGPPCGAVAFPCARGAVCSPDPLSTNANPDRCVCEVSNGFTNAPDSEYATGIVTNGLQGYFACKSIDECNNEAGSTNVCASEDTGGICVDEDGLSNRFTCFCKPGYRATSSGDHGPESCEKLTPDPTPAPTPAPTSTDDCSLTCLGAGKVCAGSPATCQCDVGFIATMNGECLTVPVVEELDPCDPVTLDDCSEPERECDQTIKKCVCLPGFQSPSGLGGQCTIQENECALGTDVECDQRGRKGPNPRSECTDRENLDFNGNVQQGYTCECILPYVDAPNKIRGTDCILGSPSPTSAPVTAPTDIPVPGVVPAVPDVPLPCTTFNCGAFSTCIAAVNQCICLPGFGPIAGSVPFACVKLCSIDIDCVANQFCGNATVPNECEACPSEDPYRVQDSADGCNDCAPGTFLNGTQCDPIVAEDSTTTTTDTMSTGPMVGLNPCALCNIAINTTTTDTILSTSPMVGLNPCSLCNIAINP